ncbi:MAG: CHASE2 domain-containing protein, partial [Candidatus Gastranaerophilales bacterium]|nr:CHASE2 domain-containing protein [Candidatus Gastranaerophilales bacterium]
MKKLINTFKNKNVKSLYYILLAIIIGAFLSIIGKMLNFDNFLSQIESKTYDLRVEIPLNRPKPNENIAIVTIDDDSLEEMEDKFGMWPWDRSAYIDAIEYLQQSGVEAIAFDLMFVGHQKGLEHIDAKLAQTISKYDNVYVSMNFDDRENVNPPVLPDYLKANVENRSKNINFSYLEVSNCRKILDEIINSTKNTGII